MIRCLIAVAALAYAVFRLWGFMIYLEQIPEGDDEASG